MGCCVCHQNTGSILIFRESSQLLVPYKLSLGNQFFEDWTNKWKLHHIFYFLSLSLSLLSFSFSSVIHPSPEPYIDKWIHLPAILNVTIHSYNIKLLKHIFMFYIFLFFHSGLIFLIHWILAIPCYSLHFATPSSSLCHCKCSNNTHIHSAAVYVNTLWWKELHLMFLNNII